MGCYQRGNGGFDSTMGSLGGSGAGSDVMALSPCYLVGIALQPCFHVIRHVVWIEVATVGIAENSLGTIVRADNNKAFAISDVENIQTAYLFGHCEL